MSELRQERDRIAGRPIVIVGSVTLVVVAVSAVIAVLFLRAHPDVDDARAPQPGAARIGILEQSALEPNAPGIVQEQEQRRALEGWRYLDAKHETAEIPIERAIDVVEARHR